LRLHIFACNRNCAYFYPIFVKNFRATATVCPKRQKLKKNRKNRQKSKKKSSKIAKIVKKSPQAKNTPQATSKLKELLLTVVDVYNCISNYSGGPVIIFNYPPATVDQCADILFLKI
jgi:hypothetical protein